MATQAESGEAALLLDLSEDRLDVALRILYTGASGLGLQFWRIAFFRRRVRPGGSLLV